MKISRKLAWLVMLILFNLVMTGCAGKGVKPEQPANDRAVALDSANKVGQTFTAHYDGLNSLYVFLSPAENGDGQIVLHLRAHPEAAVDLRTASIPVSRVKQPGYYAFEFPVLETSNRQDYYAQLEVDGAGSVTAGAANGEVYLFGALYQNGQPQDAQLTFNLGYQTVDQLLGLIQEGLTWVLWLMVGFFLFVVPGWALLVACWPGWARLCLWERLGLASGVSLAIYPLLFLWTDLIGLHLGALYAWLPPLIGLAALAWSYSHNLKTRLESIRMRKFSWPKLRIRLNTIAWPDLGLLVVISLLFAVRFWVIRNLDLPLWGDSYQHTVMAQLLVDNHGLFDSWAPYAEMTSFTYHFGFHTLVAVFHWISGLDLPASVLWTGQILNGLAVIGLIPLVMRIERSRWAALAAVTISGTLAVMPMAYTNWGRYTQLAGQAILPAAIFLTWSVLNGPLARRRALLPVWLVLGGLALTHYRVLIMALCFYPAFVLFNLRTMPFRLQMRRIFLSGIGAGALALPWFIHLYAGQILTMLLHRITTPPAQLSEGVLAYNALVNPLPYLPVLIWFLVTIGIGWGLWRRNREFAIAILWWFLIFLAANPERFNLPGSGVISNFAVIIAIYIPIALVVGPTFAWIVDELEQSLSATARSTWARQLLPAACALLLVGASLWGVMQRRQDIVPPQHSLGTRPDLRAAAWIRSNLPDETRFLVNSFSAYNSNAVVGSDGGWWLPLVARRPTTQPPLPYTSEQGPFPDYRLWVNQLTAEIKEKGVDHPEVVSELMERGVTHVYLGQLQGSTNSDRPLLEPATLLASKHFKPVYHQDRVWIFAFTP